jgi:hypothetical protein
MTDFQPAYPDTVNLDPYKRVFYSHGLVLGVDEFAQEELYLLEKQRGHNRMLHGYGTVCGLAVDWRLEEGDTQLLVAPGVAVAPDGREIRVPEAQCARLNDWLLRHRDEVVGETGSPPAASPGQVSLYLVLCHDECATDQVPVPSGPCQSLDRPMVPSRIADDFRLELRLESELPLGIEEEAVGELVALLGQIAILDAPGGMTHEEMATLVRSLLPSGSPPVSSPPSLGGHIHPDLALDLMRTAYRVWVTEVRPQLMPSGRNCASGPPQEACVLLARVDVPLTDTELGLRVDGDLTVDEGERPFLLHTRLLQEALGQCCVKGQLEGGGGAGVMHLSGAEMATGSKTFAAPLLLAATGRVVKRIALSAGQAAMTYPDITRFMAYRTLPTVRYSSSGGPLDFQGTAIFDLGIPDDLAAAEPIRVRLIWFFDVAPATGSPPSVPASEYDYTWEVRLHYFDADEHLPQTLGSVPPLNFSGTVPALRRPVNMSPSINTVLLSPLRGLIIAHT